ncbi:hypothetical protein QBC38DRAFT_398957 [Podospora fimiseda]|uniref:UVI-1 protein n=1 Tax=Podospora fimiseda TaxID=252190 RepID=A0AAN7BIB4_9PEZI|nr:hypothetical protein QBC38DRAFT_398957 [Podospora fimiseda]
MVSLRTLVTSSVAFLAAPSLAALTPTEITNNIRTLTSKSQALVAPAQSITIVNGPLIIIGQGPFPTIVAGFQDTVSTTTKYIEAMQGTPSITAESDAAIIADAFREFVKVNQGLLNILIGKAGIMSQVPIVGQPVSASLRSVESVVDTFAFGLIDLAGTTPAASKIQKDAQSLDVTLDVAIQAYSTLKI